MVKYSKALHILFFSEKETLKWFCSTVAYRCCGEENHGIIEPESIWRICWFISEPFLIMFSDSLQLVYLFPCKLSKLNAVHQLKPQQDWIKQKVIYSAFACDTKIHLDMTFAFLASCCSLRSHFWFTLTPVSNTSLWKYHTEIISRVSY